MCKPRSSITGCAAALQAHALSYAGPTGSENASCASRRVAVNYAGAPVQQADAALAKEKASQLGNTIVEVAKDSKGYIEDKVNQSPPPPRKKFLGCAIGISFSSCAFHSCAVSRASSIA